MRSDYIDKATARQIFKRMQPINALIGEICLATGLRIDDVCALTTVQLKYAAAHSGWLVVTERKTEKKKRVRFCKKHLQRMMWIAGQVYVFENRVNVMKHRTRQTVWRDLSKAGRELRKAGVNVSPHSLRKCYAVEQWDKCHDLAKVQQQLNHDNPSTTMMYIMSRELQVAKSPKKKGKK